MNIWLCLLHFQTWKKRERKKGERKFCRTTDVVVTGFLIHSIRCGDAAASYRCLHLVQWQKTAMSKTITTIFVVWVWRRISTCISHIIRLLFGHRSTECHLLVRFHFTATFFSRFASSFVSSQFHFVSFSIRFHSDDCRMCVFLWLCDSSFVVGRRFS